MSNIVENRTIHSSTRGNAQRGRRTNRPRNKESKKDTEVKPSVGSTPNMEASQSNNDPKQDITSEEDSPACWICAEPIKFYALSECNHRTCHVCSVRLRALYKKMDCTFCKHSQPVVIFTDSSDRSFESYDISAFEHQDTKLSIMFENQEMMVETLVMLRFNCPDSECDYIASGWGDLKVHVRGVHGKVMCDLCIRHKKVFSHEHTLYAPNQLYQHLPSVSTRSSKVVQRDNVEGGVHPICEFCRECFFGDDELFVHMRERHEECFVCKRDGVQHQHFQNYASLERHFKNAHFPCSQATCLEKKFVVFGSAIDLQAHMVEQHGATMSAKDKKDARRVAHDFEFNEAGSSGTDRRRQMIRPRDREHLPLQQGRSGRANGANVGSYITDPPTDPPDRPGSSSLPSLPEGDLLTTDRYAPFIARLNILTSNTNTAARASIAAVRSFEASESGPRDLISTLFNLLERDIEATASSIIVLVDVLEQEEKKTVLLAAWNGFKIEHRQAFPDLTPTASGSGYAGVAGGRVINIKHSTGSRSSHQTSRQVWDRVARAALSAAPAGQPPLLSPANHFPSLRIAKSPAPSQVAQPQRAQYRTPWASGSQSSAPTAPAIRSVSAQSGKHPAPALSLSNSAFPTLPSAPPRDKPTINGNQLLQSLRAAPPVTSAWSSSQPNANVDESTVASNGASNNQSGKKKKGKEKQMLFTLGSFPT